jgi:hypothetical protein
MNAQLDKDHLRQLRNRIETIPLIANVLDMTWKIDDGRFRFLCPSCHDFDTAVNTKTNLARYFRCQRNYNPIDMVMTVKRYSFIQAVQFLQPILKRIIDQKQRKPCALTQTLA